MSDETPAPDELDPDTERKLARKAEYEQQLQAKLRQQEDDRSDEAGRQQRQNVRVDVRIPFEIELAGTMVDVRTRDLSATGIGFVTRLPVELETEGVAHIDFGSWRFEQQFVCKFVKPLLAGWQVGAQFCDLEEDQRERLVREVFDIQRAQLRNRR